ncbi:MAG: sugar phosphate isomerase/epimerase family protein [Planctomycetota bacterium]|nr:sugar phosphate isomerase/epimerase family protein [Planctomycetota bacterium]
MNSPSSNLSSPSAGPDRRHILKNCLAGASALGAWSMAGGLMAQSAVQVKPKFRYCLNTSTINGRNVMIREQIKIASKAGYDSVEIWLRDVGRMVEAGGKLKDLASEIADLGLKVDSAIAFANWIVDDEQKRKVGLEQAKRDMAIVAELGGTHIAAPPAGATREPGLDLDAAADRYRDLLEVGKAVGVVPQVELWGFSKNLSRLEEVLHVAAGADHPDACVLLDVYHLYKGGCDFNNMDLVPGRKMHCLHMNDYPADPPRAQIGDKDRVYPGDGVAPLTRILRALAAGGFSGTLSLELFNPYYHKQPAQEVAATGIQKMKRAVAVAYA